MNFRQQRQNTLCNSTAISVVLLHTSNAEATSMVIPMSNTFQTHFQINYMCRFAIHKLLTDPSLLTINYTVLDGCLLLKANKQCNWLSKILGSGNYTGWSGCEIKMCDYSSVVFGVFRDGGQESSRFSVLDELCLFYLCVEQVWMNSNWIQTLSQGCLYLWCYRSSSP